MLERRKNMQSQARGAEKIKSRTLLSVNRWSPYLRGREQSAAFSLAYSQQWCRGDLRPKRRARKSGQPDACTGPGLFFLYDKNDF